MSNEERQLGDVATCEICHKGIVWQGYWWRHIKATSSLVSHVAIPVRGSIHSPIGEARQRIEELRSRLCECYHERDELSEALDALVEERDQYDADLERCREKLAAVREERDVALMSMTDYRVEAEHQERERAAAEAREQRLAQALMQIVEIDKTSIPDAKEAATAMRMLAVSVDGLHKLQDDHAALDAYVAERTAELRERLAATEAREQRLRQGIHNATQEEYELSERPCNMLYDALRATESDHEALGAALGQARRDGFIAGRKDVFDTLGCERITGTALMQCGHPEACLRQDDKGTAHCAWCESLERARRECSFFEHFEGHEESHMGAMGNELYPSCNVCHIGGDPEECGGDWQRCPFQRERVPKRVEQARREAIERACAAICSGCMRNLDVWRDKEGNWWHKDSGKPHSFRCRATAIHEEANDDAD